MTKARTLADFISDGSPLADGTISVSEVSGAAPLANPTFTGTASGTFSGPLTGAVTGDLTGNVTGDLTGNVTGNVTGDLTGNVTAPFVSLVGTLPTLAFSNMLLQVAVSQATDPVAVGTWFDSTASDGYKYGDLDKSGSIGAQDGLLMNQLSAGLASEAVTSRWYNIIVPSLVTQSWYADLVTDGTILAGGTLDLTNGWTIEQEAGNFHVSKDNVTKLDIASDGIDVTGEVKADKFTNDEALPTVRPSLLLDFANSKTLDPRITFTRGSTATYWDGKTTTKAEENKLLNGTTLTGTGWTNPSAMTVTPNAGTAPDGTSTATQLTLASGKAYYQTVPNVGSGTYTASVYVKQAASGSATQFRFATNNTQAWSSGGTASVTLTSSWQRVTITGTLTGGSGNMNLHMDGSQLDGLFDSNSAGNVLIWGAQVEIRGAATTFTPTSGSPIVKYQPTLQTAASGEARFDHDPVTGESKGLLIEEARTNNLTYSEQLDNAAWTKAGSYVTTNTMIAPDGTQTADKLSENAANSSHDIRQTFTGSASTIYTYSFYAKAGERSEITFFGALSSGSVGGSFNLATGVANSSYMYPVGNGWYRCWIPVTTASSGGALNMIIILNNGSASSYAGDGYSGLYLWGFQLEQGSFPTSYIPTSGSTVTRSADLAKMTGTAFTDAVPAEEVAAFCSLVDLPLSGTRTPYQLGSQSASRYGPYFSGATFNYYYGGVSNIGIANSDGTNVHAVNMFYNDVDVSFDGGAAAAVSNGTIKTGATTLTIGCSYNQSEYVCASIKKFAFYPQRLSNATLQAMTEE